MTESISLKGFLELYATLPHIYINYSLKSIVNLFKIVGGSFVRRPPPPRRRPKQFTLVVPKQYLSFPPAIDSPVNPLFSFLSYVWNISFYGLDFTLQPKIDFVEPFNRAVLARSSFLNSNTIYRAFHRRDPRPTNNNDITTEIQNPDREQDLPLELLDDLPFADDNVSVELLNTFSEADLETNQLR